MAISLHNVTKAFANNGKSLAVLKSVSMSVGDGEVLALLGPSGCGKTTLLRLMAGLEEADSGDLVITSKSGEKLKLGMIFQQPALLPWRTALENVLLPLELMEFASGSDNAERNATELLAQTGLREFKNYYPHQLSGGMKSRVAVARGLVTRPDVLLLDEPFSALDEVTRGALQDLLARIAKEMCLTVVFVTHSVDEAVMVADRVVVLSSRPATIVADIKVSLPREAGMRRDTAESLDLRKTLRELLMANATPLEVTR